MNCTYRTYRWSIASHVNRVVCRRPNVTTMYYEIVLLFHKSITQYTTSIKKNVVIIYFYCNKKSRNTLPGFCLLMNYITKHSCVYTILIQSYSGVNPLYCTPQMFLDIYPFLFKLKLFNNK
ncbi:hypothetical protein QTP88_024038 [Uroleucon formosanum]